MVWTCRANEQLQISNRVYESGVEGRRGRRRPNRVWMDGERKALNDRGLALEQAKMTLHVIEWSNL